MKSPFTPRVGGVMSADIAVPDHEREVQFYSRVLGTGETPLWRDDLMNNRGMPVIGLGARTPEYAMLPLQWMPHIQVADVAASAKCALDHGGSELMHGKDAEGKSLWAGLLDPNGVAFGIISVVTPEQIPSPDDSSPTDTTTPMGQISWLDLTTSDAKATCEFYRQVVDWSVQDIEMKDADESYLDFEMRSPDGNPAASIRHARGDNAKLPPVWLLHLPVGDLAASLGRVREGGGEVIHESLDGDGALVRAVIKDPVGVCLALVPAP